MGVAVLMPIFVGSLVAFALDMSGSEARECDARVRRLADARMDARLLRLKL